MSDDGDDGSTDSDDASVPPREAPSGRASEADVPDYDGQWVANDDSGAQPESNDDTRQNDATDET